MATNGEKKPGKALTPPGGLGEVFARAANAVRQVLPHHVTPERFLRVAWVLVNRTPALKDVAEQSPETLIAAIVQSSQLGLELGREAHLVPFKNKHTGKLECQFIPDYRGLAELARRSGAVRFIDARLVYKGDRFRVQYGTEPKIEHEPDLAAEQKVENIVCAYAVAHMTDGGPPKFEVVPAWKLEKVRASSKAADSGPWASWPHEQRLKTAVRQICKLLPQSPELASALAQDDRVDSGEIGHVVTEFDTVEQDRRRIAARTQERAEALKEQLAGQRQDAAAPEAEEELTRDVILASLDGKTVGELHRVVRERTKDLGFADLKDLNALCKQVLKVDSYQAIQRAEEATDVLWAAEVAAKAMAHKG